MTAPAITVVVPTHDRASSLVKLVSALEAQDTPLEFEVVVVDDASVDGTWDELKRLATASRLDLRPIRLERNSGAAHARNVGWRAALAPLIAFTDDDCVPTPGWLAALHSGLGHADIVQGITVPDPDQQSRMGAWDRSVDEVREGVYPTCNVGYRRAALERGGGFDDGFGRMAGEDIELAWRLIADGATHAFAPAALVHHEVHRMTYREHLREKHRWAGLAFMVRKNPDLRRSLSSPHIWKPSHPPALVAAAGLAAAASSHGRPARLLAGVALLVPYIRFRLVVWQQPVPRCQRIALLPAVLAADLYEIAVLARASARERTLVL